MVHFLLSLTETKRLYFLLFQTRKCVWWVKATKTGPSVSFAEEGTQRLGKLGPNSSALVTIWSKMKDEITVFWERIMWRLMWLATQLFLSDVSLEDRTYTQPLNKSQLHIARMGLPVCNVQIQWVHCCWDLSCVGHNQKWQMISSHQKAQILRQTSFRSLPFHWRVHIWNLRQSSLDEINGVPQLLFPRRLPLCHALPLP